MHLIKGFKFFNLVKRQDIIGVFASSLAVVLLAMIPSHISLTLFDYFPPLIDEMVAPNLMLFLTVSGLFLCILTNNFYKLKKRRIAFICEKFSYTVLITSLGLCTTMIWILNYCIVFEFGTLRILYTICMLVLWCLTILSTICIQETLKSKIKNW